MPTRPGTGTRQGVIRRHNLGTLLLHLHRDGPLLRAQLTERMQLNRSTVGALVSELEAMGAVSQEVPTGARDGAGRPSLRVQPRADSFVALAAQLQVNDVTVARVGLGGAVLDRATVGLPSGRCPDQVAA
jgi:predicted transcriptional regulator